MKFPVLYSLLGTGLVHAIPQNLVETITVTETVTDTHTETITSSVCAEHCQFASWTGEAITHTETYIILETDCGTSTHTSGHGTAETTSEIVTTVVETAQTTVAVTETPANETSTAYSSTQESAIFNTSTKLPLTGTYSSTAIESSSPCHEATANDTWTAPTRWTSADTIDTVSSATKEETTILTAPTTVILTPSVSEETATLSDSSSNLPVDSTSSPDYGTDVNATETGETSAGDGVNSTTYVWSKKHPWTSDSSIFTTDLTSSDAVTRSPVTEVPEEPCTEVPEGSETSEVGWHSNIKTSGTEIDTSFTLPVESTTTSSTPPGYGGGYIYTPVNTTVTSVISTGLAESVATTDEIGAETTPWEISTEVDSITALSSPDSSYSTTTSDFDTNITPSSPIDGTMSNEYPSSTMTDVPTGYPTGYPSSSKNSTVSTDLTSNSPEESSTTSTEESNATGHPINSEISEVPPFSTDLISNSPENNNNTSTNTGAEDEMTTSTFPTTLETSVYTNSWNQETLSSSSTEAASTTSTPAPGGGYGYGNGGRDHGKGNNRGDNDEHQNKAWDYFYNWLRTWWEKNGHN